MVTGGSGRLGRELLKLFPDAAAPTHKEMNISSYWKVGCFIKNAKPDLLIHTAALTSVRECEKDREKAWRINVEGTRNLVNSCIAYCPEVYFVYISTACIFSGEQGMYTERDLPNPKNYYALTKLVGESLPTVLDTWLVIRTNFVAKEPWPYPKAFTDRYGTYLFADDVARALKEVTERGLAGIFHIVGEERMSMFELAKKVSPSVEPTSLREYKGPPLTRDMSLDSLKWRKYRISEVV